MELAITIAIVSLALLFVGWRVISTWRVARGKECGGCGSCKAAPSPTGN